MDPAVAADPARKPVAGNGPDGGHPHGGADPLTLAVIGVNVVVAVILLALAVRRKLN
jgi:hypothetical protein